MTRTLFTLLALFLSLFTLASALPTTAPIVVRSAIVAEAPVLGTAPRSLLGRYYLRHNLAININTNTFPKPAAPLPPDTGDFAGRADRFQVLQRRRAARAVKVPVHWEDASQGDNNLLSNHTITAPPAPAKLSPTAGAVHVSTQVQAPFAAVATPLASAPRPAHARTGTLMHYGLKKAVAAKQIASL